jgi:winged helix DNA-binding protein
MHQSQIRAWWSHRQGLDGTMAGKKPAQVLERSGWARSVGGVGPYLTLFSRAGTSREAVDAAVERLEIHELPSARGCTYLLPSSDFALGLKVGEEFGKAEMKVAYKLGVTDKEIDKLSDAVVKALSKGPHDPNQIREATGDASRSLGEEGKKKGITTTLPLALGRLQVLGEIRRISIDGRLDQQRYRYALWRPNPLEKFQLSLEEAYTELARRYFRWIGPATAAQFQVFAGIGVKASKAAIEPLKLVALRDGDDRLMFSDDRERLMAFKAPAKPEYVLVSSLDAIALLRNDLRSLIDDVRLQKTVGSNEVPNHAIFDRGTLVGLWEYDSEAEKIVWSSFDVKDKAIDSAVAAMEKYVRPQLGDARSFGLDSPKHRVGRIAVLRKAAG